MDDLKNCANCAHWNNAQRLLNYSKDNGICINPKFNFNIKDGRLIGVIDVGNQRDRGKITGNPSHDIETKPKGGVLPSRYLLQTNEVFGCIFFEPK